MTTGRPVDRTFPYPDQGMARALLKPPSKRSLVTIHRTYMA